MSFPKHKLEYHVNWFKDLKEAGLSRKEIVEILDFSAESDEVAKLMIKALKIVYN